MNEFDAKNLNAVSVDIPRTPGSHQVQLGHALIKYDVSNDGDQVHVSDISVPSKLRQRGFGKQAALTFFAYLDENQCSVTLTPAPTKSGGAGKRRISDFCLFDLGFEKHPDKPERLQRRPVKTEDLLLVNGIMRQSKNSKGNRIAESDEDLAAFWLWFADSAVVDRFGRPQVSYHGTTAEFQQFEITRDIGYHFGTSQQANKLAQKPGARLLESYVHISKPIIFKSDPRAWPSHYVINELLKDVFDEKTVKSMSDLSATHLAMAQSKANEIRLANNGRAMDDKDWSKIWDEYNSLTFETVKTELKKMGFDGIRYPNKYEAKGYSWVAFENDQIKSVTAGFVGFAKSPEASARAAQRFLESVISSSVTKGAPINQALIEGGIYERIL